jgi:ribosome-associated protein
MKSQHSLLPERVEGLAQARWVLMDYLDVVVHLFTPDARAYYRLEQLWAEAPMQEVGEPVPAG